METQEDGARDRIPILGIEKLGSFCRLWPNFVPRPPTQTFHSCKLKIWTGGLGARLGIS